ncbi:hypothetical protein BH10BAC5_BH10BAC5_15330 [soil metagenome]
MRLKSILFVLIFFALLLQGCSYKTSKWFKEYKQYKCNLIKAEEKIKEDSVKNITPLYNDKKDIEVKLNSIDPKRREEINKIKADIAKRDSLTKIEINKLNTELQKMQPGKSEDTKKLNDKIADLELKNTNNQKYLENRIKSIETELQKSPEYKKVGEEMKAKSQLIRQRSEENRSKNWQKFKKNQSEILRMMKEKPEIPEDEFKKRLKEADDNPCD